MPEYFTRDDVLLQLREEVGYSGSQSKLARVIGVSRQMLSRVMRGQKPPTGKILEFCSLQRAEVYVDLRAVSTRTKEKA